MGRPCKCCEEVSSSSSSVGCQCTVKCDIFQVCTEQEFRDGIEFQPPSIGEQCPCMGGVCTYDMVTGDWSVTLKNQTAPRETNQGFEVNPSNIENWGGNTGSRCLTHFQQYRNEWNSEVSCGKYVANPFILPSPFPSELEHGGVNATEWGHMGNSDGEYGTNCRPVGFGVENRDYCSRAYFLYWEFPPEWIGRQIRACVEIIVDMLAHT